METEDRVYTSNKCSWEEEETRQCGSRCSHSKLHHPCLEAGSPPEAHAATPQPTASLSLLGIGVLVFSPDPTQRILAL